MEKPKKKKTPLIDVPIIIVGINDWRKNEKFEINKIFRTCNISSRYPSVIRSFENFVGFVFSSAVVVGKRIQIRKMQN